jgi:hypothetical protein
VKLAEFKDLCDREWGEARGDVQSLHLTNSSLLEFTTDVLLAGAEDESFLFPLVPLFDSEDVADIRVGAVTSKILNPITRSVVKVSGDSDCDMAEVQRYWGSETTPVPPNPVRALEAVRLLGVAQRKNADDLRTAIRKAREAGVSWSAIGKTLGVRYDIVYRQYRAGSPIVVTRAHH